LLQIPAADIEAVCLATGFDRDRARAALDQLARIGLVSARQAGQAWCLTALAGSCAELLALRQVPDEEPERTIGPVIGLYQMRAENLRDIMTASLPGSLTPMRAWAEERWEAEAVGARAVLSAAADSSHPAQARRLAAAFMDIAACAEGRGSGWRETEASIGPVLRIASEADDPELAGRAAGWLEREARLLGVPDEPSAGPAEVLDTAADEAVSLLWLDAQGPVGPLLFGAGAERP